MVIFSSPYLLMDDEALAQALRKLLMIPDVRRIIQEEMRAGFAELQSTIARCNSHSDVDCWLDARAAAKYMCVSKTSFDKYRYETMPKLAGYRLDGKVLYKKSDIDSFVRLYALKSTGRA
jgi:hypothetical protein